MTKCRLGTTVMRSLFADCCFYLSITSQRVCCTPARVGVHSIGCRLPRVFCFANLNLHTCHSLFSAIFFSAKLLLYLHSVQRILLLEHSARSVFANAPVRISNSTQGQLAQLQRNPYMFRREQPLKLTGPGGARARPRNGRWVHLQVVGWGCGIGGAGSSCMLCTFLGFEIECRVVSLLRFYLPISEASFCWRCQSNAYGWVWESVLCSQREFVCCCMLVCSIGITKPILDDSWWSNRSRIAAAVVKGVIK